MVRALDSSGVRRQVRLPIAAPRRRTDPSSPAPGHQAAKPSRSVVSGASSWNSGLRMRAIVVGTLNNPGSVIMEIADLDRMMVKARVDEANIAKVREAGALVALARWSEDLPGGRWRVYRVFH